MGEFKEREQVRLILQNLYDGLEGTDRDMVGIVIEFFDKDAETARLKAQVERLREAGRDVLGELDIIRGMVPASRNGIIVHIDTHEAFRAALSEEQT